MTISNNVSLFGRSISQSQRLGDLRALMDDLSRQVTTGQIAENYSGLGTRATALINLNSQEPLLKTYQANIQNVSNKMTMMNNAMASISDVGNQVITAIQTQLQNDPANFANIRQIAQQGLQTVESLLNLSIGGQYLFAGSDYASPPFIDDSALNSNFNNQLQGWLASGNTAALTANIDGFSAASLGLSSGLASSGNVTTRVNDTLNINYTVKADQAGFKDIIRALTLVANAPYPSSTDTATAADFQNVMDYALATAQRGVQAVNSTAQELAGKFVLVKAAQKQNDTDLALVQNQISALTSADTTAAIVQMQSLQVQLQSSYQVTSIVNQLSITDYI
jgi:flagellar hook-associated protein 3 FlgL